MNILDINKLKNKDYIVLLPSSDWDIKESVEYSFENVFYLDYELTDEHANTIIDFINEKAKMLVLFDYDDIYRKILPYIRKAKKVKWIYKNNIAQMTSWGVRSTFSNIMEFYDRKIVDEIGCLDNSTYEVLKNAGYKVKHILLDIKRSKVKNKNTNSIGLIGDDYNPNHNTYNQLSALKMIDYSYIKVVKHMDSTNHFINFFEIKEKEVNSLEDVIKDNKVNLYCNFTSNNFELVLKSIDKGIPCVLGNTDIFDKYSKLKKYLVLNSDDDINEIADKINLSIENKDIILKEYDKFRNTYSEKSQKQIKEFLK